MKICGSSFVLSTRCSASRTTTRDRQRQAENRPMAGDSSTRGAERVVADRINGRIRFFSHLKRTLVRSAETRRVNTVSEKYNRFSAGNRFELFLQYVLNGVVKTRPAAGARVANRYRDHVAIGCRSAFHLDPIVKRHHHHTVCWFQFVDELDCGILDIVQPDFCGTACIDQ